MSLLGVRCCATSQAQPCALPHRRRCNRSVQLEKS